MRYLLTTWIDNQKYVEKMNDTLIEKHDEKLLFNGDFYIGFNGNLFTDGNISQIKCVRKINGSKLETITLEVDFDLDVFKDIKYIRKLNITYSKMSPNLYKIETLNEYKDLVPGTYNGKILGDIQKRLMNMTKQNKIVKV